MVVAAAKGGFRRGDLEQALPRVQEILSIRKESG